MMMMMVSRPGKQLNFHKETEEFNDITESPQLIKQKIIFQKLRNKRIFLILP
jgi:hypothetical protein